MWRRISIIARREFLYTVRRREFLLVTLGLPLLYVFIVGIVGVANVAAVRSSQKGRVEPKAIGFLDLTGKLDRKTLSETRDGIAGRVYETREAGQKDVQNKEIRALVEIPADFAKPNSAGITVYAPPQNSSFFGGGSNRRGGGGNYDLTIRRAALAGKVDEASISLATRPTETKTLYYDPKLGTFGEANVINELGKFAVPYVFSLLLMMSVLMGASYLLHGIVEEKENRVIEVLLSATSHEELLAGKIIGLGGASLLQLGIWVSGAVLTAAVIAVRAPQAASLVASPGLVTTALVMFLLGFCLYATLMASIGSLGTSWRESSQMSGGVVMPLVVPLMLMPVILETPNGPIPQFLSFFPLTAPIGMMMRIAAGGGSALDVIIASVILAVTVVFAIKLAARMFRLSLLLYGQRPSAGFIFKHLFAKAA
jgi:ABC-2 type transport system permease protein